MPSSYTKLRDGSWGVRLTSDIPTTPGSQVYVTTKAGATKVETLARVLWSGNGVAICSIAPRASNRPSVSRSYPQREGSPGCTACRRMGTYCQSCAFDEFDC